MSAPERPDLAGMDVVIYPHPVLRRAAQPIEEIDDYVRLTASRMLELMLREKGVGLAAPQVAWGARLIVTSPSGKPEDARVYLNPVIEERSREKDVLVEGCLSLPAITGKIERSTRIRLRAFDLTGEDLELSLEGFPARVVQHEVDHLDGILIVDRMSPAERAAADKKLKELIRIREREAAPGASTGASAASRAAKA